jgi:glycosyltransferase involved in cell wall biosynthesis
MEKICIDARMYGVGHTGIGRYLENLLDNLPPEAKKNIILLVYPDQYTHPKLSDFSKIKVRSHPYSIFSQIEIPFWLFRIRPKLLHVPHFTIPLLWPGKTIITIHDLIKNISVGRETTTRAPFIYKIKYYGYLIIIKIAIKRAVQIIVPTRYWLDKLGDFYPQSKGKTTVTYEGVDSNIFKNNPKIHFDNPPYIIYTGNLYPHKNFPLLLAALKLIPGLRLKLVCSRSVFYDRAKALVVSQRVDDRVDFMGFVSDSRLNTLYQKSLVFVTPAFIEGFGLPGIEAMASGTPVISSRASCLPEVYGNAALFFDPHSAVDLADQIKHLMTSPQLREKMVTMGLKRVSRFSWGKMGQETWKIYRNELH